MLNSWIQVGELQRLKIGGGGTTKAQNKRWVNSVPPNSPLLWPLVSRECRPPSWIFKIPNSLTVDMVERPILHRRAKLCADWSNRHWDKAIYRLFKMMPDRHLRFVGGAILNQSSSFHDIKVLTFCSFGLKRPTHTPQIMFFSHYICSNIHKTP